TDIDRIEMPHCGEPLLFNNLLCSTLAWGQRMQFSQLKRREFITLFGSAAAVWPLAAHAQQGERMRRIGVLMALAADDPDAQIRILAFQQGLQQPGWTAGRNLQIETRWATIVLRPKMDQRSSPFDRTRYVVTPIMSDGSRGSSLELR